MPKRWAQSGRKEKFERDTNLKSESGCSFVRHTRLAQGGEKQIVAVNLLMQKRVGPFDDVQSATLPEDCQLCVLNIRKRIVPGRSFLAGR